MNQIEEDMTSDEELNAPLVVIEPTKSELMRPPHKFKGIELFPFTYAYEILFNQVRDQEDTGLFTWMAFVFMLRRRNSKETWRDHRNWIRGIAWRVETFRDALLDWMDDNGPFTPEDKIEAKTIYEETMKAIAQTAIEPIPVRGKSSQKKTLRQKKPQ